MNTHTPQRRAGFTLVEMLVVIVIIGVLASLITVVAAAAIKRGKEGVRLTEMGQMAAAIKSYKAKYGRVPPDFSNSDALTKHVRKRFSRMGSGATVPTGISPAEALVIWLQGQSPNVLDPFSGKGTPLFEFDKSRLRLTDDGDQYPAYYPPDDDKNPYVYFDMVDDDTNPPSWIHKDGATVDEIRPYSGTQDEFQIVCAGVDLQFGGYGETVGGFPNGPFPGGHADNLATFSDTNMEDSMP